MPSVLKHLRNETVGAVPAAGSMQEGQLAYNPTDKRLFAKTAAGSVVQIGVAPSDLATVATSGNYNDLSNKYVLPAATTSVLGGIMPGIGLSLRAGGILDADTSNVQGFSIHDNVSGTYDVDASLYSSALINLSGDTTLNFINLPLETDGSGNPLNCYIFRLLFITNGFTLTWPDLTFWPNGGVIPTWASGVFEYVQLMFLTTDTIVASVFGQDYQPGIGSRFTPPGP